MLILDTDILSLLEWKETPLAERILSWLDSSNDAVYATVVSFEEQMRGWIALIAKTKSIVQQVDAYRRLTRSLTNYCKIPVLEFDESAATHFQEIKRTKMRISVMGGKIAAIVLSVNGTLVTRNRRDFEVVPNLQIFDWK